MDGFGRALLFISVVEQGSLAAAARRNNLSPSVVSKRLAELEQMLGVQLLRRTTRTMCLTEAGEQFYQQMRGLGDQWQSLLDETASLGKEVKGRLTLAAPQPVLTRVLLAAVNEFQQNHPNIEVLLLHTDYADLPRSDADITLCRQLEKLDTATTIGVPICEYHNSLFAAPVYLAEAVPENVEQLAEHRCIAYGMGSSATWSFENGACVDVYSSLISNNTEVIIQAALAGQGIAFIPGMIIKQELESKQLEPVLPALKSRSFQFWAYYQKQDYIPLKTRVFLDFVKGYFAS